MAQFKTDPLLSGISGKIGGQSLSNQSQYNTIRNITQPTKNPNLLQLRARSQTARIATLWKNLSAAEKLSYETEAPAYKYLDAFGNEKSRTGYGLFLYLNQNLSLNDTSPPTTAPAFVAPIPPVIIIVSSDVSSLIISAQNINASYTYLLYASVNLPFGRLGTKKYERFCAFLSYAELVAGVDIFPQIENTFPFEMITPNISFSIASMHITTGNRMLGPTILTIDLTAQPDIIYFSSFNSQARINGHAWSQDGLKYTSQLLNAAQRIYNLTTPYDLSTATFFGLGGNPAGNTGNIIFQNSALLSITGRFTVSPILLQQYNCITPLSYVGATLAATINVLGTGSPNLVYIDPTGTILIGGTNGGIQKYSLSTPFSLATATLTQQNLVYLMSDARSGTFSYNGRYYYETDGFYLKQYLLNSAYDLASISSTLVYNTDVSVIPGLGASAYISLFLSNDGQYLSIGVYRGASVVPNTFVFKLLTPFMLGPIV